MENVQNIRSLCRYRYIAVEANPLLRSVWNDLYFWVFSRSPSAKFIAPIFFEDFERSENSILLADNRILAENVASRFCWTTCFSELICGNRILFPLKSCAWLWATFGMKKVCKLFSNMGFFLYETLWNLVFLLLRVNRIFSNAYLQEYSLIVAHTAKIFRQPKLRYNLAYSENDNLVSKW